MTKSMPHSEVLCLWINISMEIQAQTEHRLITQSKLKCVISAALKIITDNRDLKSSLLEQDFSNFVLLTKIEKQQYIFLYKDSSIMCEENIKSDIKTTWSSQIWKTGLKFN